MMSGTVVRMEACSSIPGYSCRSRTSQASVCGLGRAWGLYWGVAGGVVAAATIPLAIKLLAIIVIGFFFYCLLGGVLIAFIWHSIVSR